MLSKQTITNLDRETLNEIKGGTELLGVGIISMTAPGATICPDKVVQ